MKNKERWKINENVRDEFVGEYKRRDERNDFFFFCVTLIIIFFLHCYQRINKIIACAFLLLIFFILKPTILDFIDFVLSLNTIPR